VYYRTALERLGREQEAAPVLARLKQRSFSLTTDPSRRKLLPRQIFPRHHLPDVMKPGKGE